MQLLDVIAHGYWHARSLAYTTTPMARMLEWLRMPGDLVFMFLGALPLASAIVWGYFSKWRDSADYVGRRTPINASRIAKPS